MIPQAARKLIEDWPLGFVATADAEGRPNLSPKGTFRVIDERGVGFAEIRSPRTLANLAVRPEVEINFVDVLTRRGVRLRGTARVHRRGTEAFASLFPRFQGLWPSLEPMMAALVIVDVTDYRALSSPAYDAGATEAELRAHYAQKIRDLAGDG